MKQNGNPAVKGMPIEVPESATTLERFKEILHEEHGVENSANFNFFNQDGVEIRNDTFILIKDGEIVYYERTPGTPFDFNNILAQYEILEKLGKGGFGSVHRGKHKETNKLVAVKYMDLTEYSNFNEKFSVSCK